MIMIKKAEGWTKNSNRISSALRSLEIFQFEQEEQQAL